MIKSVSTLSIIVAGVMCIVPTFGAQMTPQIQRLLDQKQEKIKKLEECEGKKQGWMIAGISTIGVTAVGVGLNIAQASKRNRLDDEIDTARHDLEKKQEDLSRIQNQISEKERENAKLECSQQKGMVWKNGQCVPVVSGEKASDEGFVTAPELDTEPDGKIGAPCGENDAGKWQEKSDGNNTCSNANESVQCECVVETSETPGGGEKSDKSGDGKKASGKTGGDEKSDKPGDDAKPKQESNLQKCLRERADSEEGKACCYLSKSVAKWDGKSCICEDDKEFSIGSNGRGKCKDKEGDDKPVACEEGYVRILHGDGKCVKVDYLQGAKCACKDGKYDCSLIDDNNGKFICQSSKGWGSRCSCQECPDNKHYSTLVASCVKDCAADEKEYGGFCLKSAEYDQLKTDATYGLYCIRSYNSNPGGFADATPCAKICKNLGGDVVNVTNGSMMHAAYSGCDCSNNNNENCKKIFKGKLPNQFTRR